MLRNWRFWLGVLISVFFLYLSLRGVKLREAWDALRSANYLYLVPGFVLYFIGVWIRSMRWAVLLRPIKRLSAGKLFPTVVIGYMANNILPARLGEVVRAYLLGEQEKISKSSTFATIIVERMFDGLSMIAFMIVILWLFPIGTGAGADLLRSILNVGAPLFFIAVVLFLIIASSRSVALRLADAVFRILPGNLGQRVGHLVETFLDGLAVLRSPRDVLLVFVMSIIIWLFEAGMYYMIMLGFGFLQPFYVLLLATAAANLFTIAPSTPGYVGVFDFPVRATLTTFGVAESLAISYTLVLHAALWLPITLLGLYYLWREGLTLGWLQQQGRTRGDEPPQTGVDAKAGHET
jgi:glycosyltransferase 2 family protein